MLRKKSFLLEKAKKKEEEAFRREKELLLQRRIKTQETCLDRWSFARSKVISENETENKWEVSSDTSLSVSQRRKSGYMMNRKASLHSSHESIFSSNSTYNSGGVQTAGSCSRVRSTSCILPPITIGEARK